MTCADRLRISGFLIARNQLFLSSNVEVEGRIKV